MGKIMENLHLPSPVSLAPKPSVWSRSSIRRSFSVLSRVFTWSACWSASMALSDPNLTVYHIFLLFKWKHLFDRHILRGMWVPILIFWTSLNFSRCQLGYRRVFCWKLQPFVHEVGRRYQNIQCTRVSENRVRSKAMSWRNVMMSDS